MFGLWWFAATAATSLRFAGSPAELVIGEVSERTVRMELSPLDEQGKPRPAIACSVLVPFVGENVMSCAVEFKGKAVQLKI